MGIKIDELGSAIQSICDEYADEVTQVTKEAVEKVANGVNKEIKNHITFKRSAKDKYVRAFKVVTTRETRRTRYKAWYVGNNQHTLTHLLENGHQLPQGGRSAAYPHIKYGEEFARANLEKEIEEGLE